MPSVLHSDCNICERTLHADTNTHELTSGLAPATTDSTSFSLAWDFSLLTVVPHSSATVLCTSGSHFGSTSANALHVSSIASAGMATYLKMTENVSSRILRVSAGIIRGSNLSRRSRTGRYRGAIVVRRSCDSFCKRL